MPVIPSQIYGFNVNGLSATSTPLSGYTFATPFTFTVVTDSFTTQAAVTNAYQIIWWFGDGNTSTDYSPVHTYQWPGVYEVKLALYNNNVALSASPFTFATLITAANYVQDRLVWNTSINGPLGHSWNDIMVGQLSAGACFFGYQSCESGVASSGPVPLAFDYYTTITDNSQIIFNLYSQNSLSQPYTEVLPNQITNLRPSWRFTSASATSLDDESALLQYSPASSTQISLSGVVVGLSGTVQFYYVDDTPSTVTNTAGVSANPTILWVTLDTSQIGNPQEYNYSTYPSFSNSMVLLSSYYYVRSLVPDHINVTVNGEVGLNNIYWPGVESRFVTTIASTSANGNASFLSNVNLLNYPLSSSNLIFYVTLLSGTNPSVGVPVNVRFNTSTNPITYLQYVLTGVDSLGKSTGGSYIGTFTPYSSASNAYLVTGITSGTLYYVSDYAPDPTTGYNPLNVSVAPITYSLTTLSGASVPFGVFDFDNTYFARKNNGAFDYGAALKGYALQETINQNEVLFNIFLASVAGVSATNEDTFGGEVYEKIANYVSNISDPYIGNLNQFYSLTNLLGLEIDNYNYESPPSLRKIVDLYTVQQSRVWGADSLFNRNFSLSAGHTNLGPFMTQYVIATTMVSAGQQIVLNDMFNTTKYELLEVPKINSYASVTARNLQSRLPTSAYPLSAYPLTTYPLSAFFGWGISLPIEDFYYVYVYTPGVDGSQKEGLINWNDPYTTLNETASGHNDWVKDEGTLETIYNYYIHKGLNLINTTAPAPTYLNVSVNVTVLSGGSCSGQHSCTVRTGFVTVTVTGGSGNYSYSWSPGLQGYASADYSTLSATTFTMTLPCAGSVHSYVDTSFCTVTDTTYNVIQTSPVVNLYGANTYTGICN